MQKLCQTKVNADCMIPRGCHNCTRKTDSFVSQETGDATSTVKTPSNRQITDKYGVLEYHHAFISCISVTFVLEMKIDRP